MKMTAWYWPSTTPCIICNSSSLGRSGTSRVEGATVGKPPFVRMIWAISLARRLSKESTRNPLNPDTKNSQQQNSRTRATGGSRCWEWHESSIYGQFVLAIRFADLSSAQRKAIGGSCSAVRSLQRGKTEGLDRLEGR